MSAQADSHHDSHDHADDGKVHAHVSSTMFLVAIFCALIFLTFVTVAVSYFDLGPWNLFMAIAIATLKATLVGLFFMHLLHDKPFNGFVFMMAFAFLGAFIVLTFTDLTTRAQVDPENGARVLRSTGEMAPGGLPQPPRAAPGTGAAESHSSGAHH